MLACLCFGTGARAQSSGSFPEPAPSTPAAVRASAPQQLQAAPAAPLPRVSVAPAASPPAVLVPTPATSNAPSLRPSAAASTLGDLPPLLPYAKGLPVPAGYRVVHRSSGLTLGGGLTFAAAYLAGLGLAAGQGFGNGTGYVAIPVAGPWGAIGARSFSCKVPVTITPDGAMVQKALNQCVGQAFDEVTSVVFLTADGLVQATGAVLFFIGLASGYEELVREDLPKAAVGLLPGGGMSLSVSGKF